MIHLHLPTPCHEDWDAMSLRDQGRHCAACQKTVVDFTAMSDAQLVRFFDNYKDLPICGRFANTQLQRPLGFGPVTRKPWPLAAALLAGLGLGATGYAQSSPPMTGMVIAHQPTDPLPDRAAAGSQVVDADGGQGLIGATVAAFDGNGHLVGGTTTDAGGKFSLLDLPKKYATIEVSYPGYHTQTLERPYTETLRVQLPHSGDEATVISAPLVREVEYVSTGLTVVTRIERRPWWKRLFPRRERKSWGPDSNKPAARPTEALPAEPRTTQVEASPAPQLTVTPNPARTEVQVRFTAGLVFPVQLRWISVDGRVLRTQAVTADEPTVFQLPKGGNGQRTLLLSITDTNGQVTTERIVQTIE